MGTMKGRREGSSAVQSCSVLSLLLPTKNKHIYNHNRLIGVETEMYRSSF